MEASPSATSPAAALECDADPSGEGHGRRTILECLRTRRPGRDPRVILCVMIGTELVSTPMVIYVFGYQAGWRTHYLLGLVPCVASLLAFVGLNLRLRADEVLKNKPFLLVTTVLGLSAGYLIVVASIAKTDDTPFKSRFLFYVAMFVISCFKTSEFMWAGLESTILDASFGRLVWLALVRAARLTDAATDAGVASTLYYMIQEDNCWRCASMVTMFIVACVSSLCTLTVGMLFIFWPGAHARERYPWLLVPSFISQLSVLAVMGVLGLGDSRLPAAANVHHRAFLALSACFSVTSFFANLLGVRRLMYMVRSARRILPTLRGSRKSFTSAYVVAVGSESQDADDAGELLDVEAPLPVRREPLQACASR